MIKISLGLDQPGYAVSFNMEDLTYKRYKTSSNELSNGYGYFKVIDGIERFIALFTDSNSLYFFCGKLVKLNINDCSAYLKQGFFKDIFKIFKNGTLIECLKYKATTYDAGVIEDVFGLLSDKKHGGLRIKNTIKILSEIDPNKRKIIDAESFKSLEEAKSIIN